MCNLASEFSTELEVESGKCLKNFVCPQCNECFKYRRHYEKHVEGHKQNNCKYCGKLFTIRKKLAAHLYNEHKIVLKVSKYCCQFCDRSFVKKLSLYQHSQLHAAGKHVCLCCGMFFSEFSDYVNHQEKHKYEKPFKCEKCEEKFSRRQQFLLHVKGHEKYQCLTCEEGFSAHFKLAEHKRKGHNIKPLNATHECEKCHRSFHLRSALVLHQRVHKGEEYFNCADCGKDFNSRRSYSKHLKSVAHGTRKEKNMAKIDMFICDVCGKICKEKYALSLHVIRVHSKEEPKKCNFCDYRTTSKANLKRHMEFHTGDRKFICECCGASFYMLCTLKEHYLYVHSNERKFQCSMCSKSFKRKCGLNRHMLNHSESRPYECHCGQTYKRMSHLKRHKESSHGLVSQRSNLCRLRCDGSGGFVPVVEEGGIKARKNMSKALSTVPEAVTTNEDNVKIEFLVTSHNSYSAEGSKLVLSSTQGVESTSCPIIPNIHIELNSSSSSAISKKSDELKLMNETPSINHLLAGNSSLFQRTSRMLSPVEGGVATEDLPSSTLSDVPFDGSPPEKSDYMQNACQNIEGISHYQIVSDSSPSELVHFIQESHVNIPLIDLLQVVTGGNALVEDNMVLLCVSSLPVEAITDQ
ncbi:zinc finger protein ZFP2-like [Hetaerina americana]|uniref:zinc finger protein ZFP2-like n=1 Tax=Hetaerina americana TaxID=62018 RepID=UPI003A7F1224